MRAAAWFSLSIITLGPACVEDPPEQAAVVGMVVPVPAPDRLDLLIVVDDSGSMSGYQATLAANLDAIAQVLLADDVDFDVRVAITTTSVPGPTCAGPLARGGELLTDTCRAAPPQAFEAPSEFSDEVVDQREICNDACPHDQIARRPSPLDDYAEQLAIRPWFEPANNSYGGNLPGDVSFEHALSCAALRGFGGCEFESPLAAASRALEHMGSPGDPAFGFLRDDTPLMILFIGDEDDCSHHAASASMFDPEGERVFWSNPAADAPTSAVCHNAGSSCDADGCVPIDRDAHGQPTTDYADATLRSLVEFEAKLATLRLERGVFVSMIGGVTPNGLLSYAPSDDAAWIEEFGWGPGCENAMGQRAQPPGRLYQLVAPIGAASSICSADWTPALESVANKIRPQLPPWCGPVGVADTDPSTVLVEPDCELIVRTAADETWPVPPCVRDEQGFVLDANLNYAVPAGADRCHVLLTDSDQQTESLYDDISDICVDAERPLEVSIAVRPGTLPVPRDSVYALTCASD
ncbi:hypothetical protein [Enhygromyxa salina]|uniref:hypothetical protein n=1 Tax=Enhygromyxa salina TaxID=215803 RepID=UPI0011B29B7A|nr:hypothetical protein [Enhygromyxa salina]